MFQTPPPVLVQSLLSRATMVYNYSINLGSIDGHSLGTVSVDIPTTAGELYCESHVHYVIVYILLSYVIDRYKVGCKAQWVVKPPLLRRVGSRLRAGERFPPHMHCWHVMSQSVMVW